MQLSDHDLKQIDEKKLASLDEKALLLLSSRLLADLKESRDRLNQTSSNSSRPPGSDAPWKSTATKDKETDTTDEDDSRHAEINHGAASAEKGPLSLPETDGASRSPDKTSVKRKPGKQKGAKGFGRVQIFQSK